MGESHSFKLIGGDSNSCSQEGTTNLGHGREPLLLLTEENYNSRFIKALAFRRESKLQLTIWVHHSSFVRGDHSFSSHEGTIGPGDWKRPKLQLKRG